MSKGEKKADKPPVDLSPEAAQRELKQVLSDMDEKVTEESQAVLSELIGKVMKDGMAPKTALQLSDDVMEGIYAHAYNMYNRGLYQEASHIFRLLIILDATEPKYLMGLAACLHMQKQYESATAMYMLCSATDPDNPLPPYHAADCLIKVEAWTEAIIALEQAVKEAGKQEQYRVLVERAQLMIESLRPESEKELHEAKKWQEEELEKIRKEKKRAKKK